MIVAVASGKGGTGKTTVAVNLALALADEFAVQVLDCDTEEPNAHLFLAPALMSSEKVTIPVPVIDEVKCTHCGRCARVCAFHAIAAMGEKVLVFPELCHGCGGCVLACPKRALSERPREIGFVESGFAGKIQFAHGILNVGSPLTPPVVKAVKNKIDKSRAVIIDAPPGTSCPVVNTVTEADYCLLVTEPTPFGLNDLMLAVGMVRHLGIPFGVIINRSDHGDWLIEEYCAQEDIPVMLKIPFRQEYAIIYSEGGSLVEESPDLKCQLQRLWQEVEEVVESARAISHQR